MTTRASGAPAGKAPRAAVRDILRRDWDPIGIAGAAAALDEYDGYADGVLALLRDLRPAAEIAAWLTAVEKDDLGLTPGPSRALVVAERLVALRHGPWLA